MAPCQGGGSLPAALELVFLVSKEDVEACEGSITAADVALQLDLHIFRYIDCVDLLLQRPQAISQHHDLVKERFYGPALLLQAGRAWPQHEVSSSPPFCRCHSRDARFLPDHATKNHFDVHSGVLANRRRNPLALADNGERLAVGFNRRTAN